MRLFLDLDTRSFIESAQFQRAVSSLVLKRRDHLPVDVQFLRSGVVVELATGATGKLGLKADKDFNGSFAASDLEWAKSGTGDATTYRFDLNLNTVQINALFAGVPTPSSVSLMLEIEWAEGDLRTSSNTLAVSLENDIVRGDEGIIEAGSPEYPLPDEIELVANKGAAGGYASLDGTGKVPATQLPPASLDSRVTVADDAARFALTTDDVQDGDYVFQTDALVLYEVTDAANLGNANGYTALATVPWGNVTGKPETFTPSTHTHSLSDTTGLQEALDVKATSAQGALADNAVQRGQEVGSLKVSYAEWAGHASNADDAGSAGMASCAIYDNNGRDLTACLSDATAFATAAQGATADSALQPTGDGSGLSGVLKDASAFATAAQGALADAVFLQDVSSGAVAYWPLNDLADATGNGNLLTDHGSITFGAGKIGNCALINGNTDGGKYLASSVSGANTSTGFSISMWIKGTVGGVAASVVQACSSDHQGWFIGSDASNDLAFLFGNGSGWSIDTAFGTYIVGTWHHIVMTADPATATSPKIRVFMDGELVGTWDLVSWAAASVELGHFAFNYGSSDYGWPGDIDEVGVWHRPLSLSEVLVLYKNGNGWPYKFGTAAFSDATAFATSAHKSAHATGGSDQLAPSDIGAPKITEADSAPGSPSAGDLWFDSTSARLMVRYGGAWIACSGPAGPTSPGFANIYEAFEHFENARIAPKWSMGSNDLGGTGLAYIVDGKQGVFRHATGTAASANQRAGLQSNGSVLHLGQGTVMRCTWNQRFAVPPNATDTGVIRFGFIDSGSTESTDGAFYRLTDAGNLFAVTRSNNVESAMDCGFRPDSTTWYSLGVEINAAGTAATFYNGATTLQTITTNIPTGSGRQTGIGTWINRTAATATSLNVDVDWLHVKLTYPTALVL